MARKPAAVEQKEQILIAYYKWEFLRRNAQYRKDYRSFMQEFGAWFRKHGAWYDRRRRYDADAFQFFANVIAPNAKEICERWQISDPFSPAWDFEKSGYRHIYTFDVLVPTDCLKEDAGKGWNIPTVVHRGKKRRMRSVKQSRLKRLSRLDHHVVLHLDLRRPLSRLLRDAKDLIRQRKIAFDALNPKPVPTVRRRLDLYDVYLRVWDLRAQNKTFAAIGELVFPGQAGATQHAVDSFRRAKELIEGGYKELM